jgi:phosphohistidine phosphatase
VQLLLLRHGIAEEREDFAQTGQPDSKRPLTAKGRKKLKRVARALADLVPAPAVLAASPLTRAQQTAEIVARRYNDMPTTTVPALDPGHAYENFLRWLLGVGDVDTIIAVGHEPHLSGLAAWFLNGGEQQLFELKKGGACLLVFDGDVRAGSAQLSWLLTPSQLRALRD